MQPGQKRNLSLRIDETLLRDAQRLARERGTTVAALVREFLCSFVEQNLRRNRAKKALKAAMRSGVIARLEDGVWRRDDLYERN